MKRLENKVALITGGTSGIGLGCAERFAEEGAKVIIVSRNTEHGAGVELKLQAQGKNVKFIEMCIRDRYGRMQIFVYEKRYKKAEDYSGFTVNSSEEQFFCCNLLKTGL